ncbi:hypothetical protein SAMN05216271_0621 [Halopseudomonas sabulinigri]|uniref:Uncharacterized protein n=1 Tax=Halopseudomonas sabulinigri TaxID=472181 RepID=A0A1H1MK98_9GAMM|nr:hypothetical protein SAMN05216271_0621 [Halopseudomonas sabulinigri]
MHPRRRTATHQHRCIRHYAKDTDSQGFFNLLTAPAT